MRYVVHFGPEAMHIELEGSFTFADTRQFHKMLLALMEVGERPVIRLNLSRLSQIDATGLRLLMMVYDLAKKMRRELIFVQPQTVVLDKLIEAGRFNSLNIAA